MQKDRRPSFIISGISRGQNHMMYSLETMGFHVEYPMELELSWNRTFSSFHTYLPTWNYHKKRFCFARKFHGVFHVESDGVSVEKFVCFAHMIFHRI